MSPHTETLLRAVAALAVEAQRDPTSKALGRLREARGRAEAAWVAAGCPDLPEGSGRPTAPPPAPFRAPVDDRGVARLVLELVGQSDKALRVSDGETSAWLPRALVWRPGSREPLEFDRGDLMDFEADVPAWLADEKGLR